MSDYVWKEYAADVIGMEPANDKDFTGLLCLIRERTALVAVAGLGHVGLTTACVLADAGFRVVGVDTDKRRADAVAHGRWPLDPDEPDLPGMLADAVGQGRIRAGADYSICDGADVGIVAVPTPLTPSQTPDIGPLVAALEGLRRYLAPPALVSVESTLAPGTMRDVVAPTFEGRRFWLAHCPERLSPGRMLHNAREITRVVGGAGTEAADLAAALYRHVCRALAWTDALSAEITKTAENAYYDVRIAFANELALICEDLDADVWEVRRLINTRGDRDVLRSGPGVGGACIPKDPWLLMSALTVDARLVREARELNDWMPGHVARLVADALEEAGAKTDGAVIAILGASYREGTAVTCNSPAGEIGQALEALGARCRYHDPRVPGLGGDVRKVLAGADAAVIAVAHREYFGLNWRELGGLMRRKVLVDAVAVELIPPPGFAFRALGRGR